MKVSQKQKNQSGFSLVELMVVVAIIGILTGIAVPRFQTFKARAIQTEGKTGLNGVFLAMQAYEANYSEYPNGPGNAVLNNLATAAGIGFAVSGANAKYQYRVSSQRDRWAASGYTTAVLSGTRFDNMRVNANKWLCFPYDAVQQQAALLSATLTGTGRQCPQVSAGAANWAPTLVPTSDVATLL